MRKDFEKFFTKLQLDFNNISKQKEKIDEEYRRNMLSDDQYNNFISYYNIVKVNYDRVNYVRYLLHKPPRIIENIIVKLTTLKANKEIKRLKDATLEENSIALDKVKEEMLDNE